MQGEVTLSHGFVGGCILAIGEVLLTVFQLPLCLGKLERFQVRERDGLGLGELVLICRLVGSLDAAELKVSFSELLLGVLIQKRSLRMGMNRVCFPKTSKSGCVRGLSHQRLLRVADIEVSFLYLLSYLFILMRFIRFRLNGSEVLLTVRLSWEL